MTRSFNKLHLGLFYGLGAVSIFAVLAAFGTGQHYLALIPFGILLVALGVVDFKKIYFLLLCSLPLSTEYYFSSSLATDLPDEPLMVGLMMLTVIYLFTKRQAISFRFFTHPVILLLGLEYVWILIAGLNGMNPFISFKYFLAKTWFISTFVFMTAIVIRKEKDLRTAFWCLFIPMTFTIIQTLLRHGIIYHFAFDEVNKTVGPFYRNHVNYAAMISIFYPLIWLAASWYKKGSLNRLILDCSKVLFTLGIFFSYTRTAWLAILIIIPFTLLIRWKLTKVFLVTAAILLPLVLMHLFSENRFLKYAPEYATTIYHDDLNEHLASTFEGKDVSGMERIYRWVAASRMIQDKPWMGFGPENFYPYYKSYTINSFVTYVSDNEERSTVHNYFILTAVEQGIIGFLIFISLLVLFFIEGEDLYHKTNDEKQKRVVMTVLVCMATVMVNISLSDMLETDKVGSLYFILISLLVLLQTNGISFDMNRE